MATTCPCPAQVPSAQSGAMETATETGAIPDEVDKVNPPDLDDISTCSEVSAADMEHRKHRAIERGYTFQASVEDAAGMRLESDSPLAPQPLKEVKSDPLLYNAESRPVASLRPSAGSQPLLDNGLLADWPREVRRLLDPYARHSAAEGRDKQWAHPAEQGLRLCAAAFQIPHPRKAETGGEDSFFLSSDRCAAGVADGVGEWGWRFRMDPRAFADGLMGGASSWVEKSSEKTCQSASQKAAAALQEGFASSKSFGSATAIITSLDSYGTELGVANLGDAGLRQIRHHRADASDDLGTRIVGRTKVQQHSFNCPFQLSHLPQPTEFDRLRAEGKGALVRAVQNRPATRQDDPSDAQLYTFAVKEGDLIILGSDGVFDNLHDCEVCQLAECTVSPFEAQQSLDLKSGKLTGRGSTKPEKVAEAIAQAAFYRSRDPSAPTPFSVNAREAGLCHIGGKIDDITVVAAWAVRTCSTLTSSTEVFAAPIF